MKIYKSLPEISDKDISTFENDIEIRLPKSYKDFLKKNNGGYINPNSFYFNYNNNREVGEVSYFFAITHAKSVRYHREMMRSILPKKILPIADDDTGNFICLSVDEPDFGSVYYYLHERFAEGEENLILVAEDLSTFLDSLFEYNENES